MIDRPNKNLVFSEECLKVRKLVALCALSIALVSTTFAEVTLKGMEPRDARTMGTGGASLVFSTGYDSFFGNPAGFAGKRTLTLADASAWVYARPNPAEIAAIRDFLGKSADADDQARIDSLVATNGLGAGAAAGFGWTGGGLGVGATLLADAIAMDYSLAAGGAPDPAVRARALANGIAGIAWPINLGGFTFTIGADVRAFYLLESFGTWSFDDLAAAWASGSGFRTLLNAQTVRGGYGLSLDTGATLAFGPLALGVMVRDYGYRFQLGDATLGDILVDSNPPMSGAVDCTLSPSYTAGARLVLGDPKGLLTTFFLEAEDPLALFALAVEDVSTLASSVHAGLDIGLARILSIRMGLNQGLPSFGLGIDLHLYSADFAIFGMRDPDAPSQPRTGMALRAAIRL